MRIAYFDCFSGASGDMLLGACLDAGLDLDTLSKDLARLGLEGYALEARSIRKQGFAATQFEVRVDPSTDQPHRHLKHIRDIIDRSGLPGRVRERAMAIFTRLAEVEAAAHGTDLDKVHFHEVGAVDAIVDIVGVCIGLDRLGIDRVFCSPIPTGSGTARCKHGLIPVPAPATAGLLKGALLAACDEPGELTTPTGAAILVTLADGFGPLPAMALELIGVGAGRREGKHRPNILRVLIGESTEAPPAAAGPADEADEIIVLEANLDDVSGEVISYTRDRLFKAGALDVFATPIYMKKNRPGTELTVLAPPALREAMEAILFAETTTFGIRSHLCQRRKLSRAVETVNTEFGPIGIKVGRRRGQVATASPEFEDCREAAQLTGRPLQEVMDAALRAWQTASRPSQSG